jgi:hypothetical protein
VSQSTIIAGALLAAFVVWLAAKGRLTVYLGLVGI